MRRAVGCLLAVLVLVGAGCGATPPQAPAPQANRVASALEGIAEACGEADQQRALPQFGGSTPGPEQAALMRARELARVFVRNPAWIYQGDTLRQVLGLASARLQECRLASAARALSSQRVSATASGS